MLRPIECMAFATHRHTHVTVIFTILYIHCLLIFFFFMNSFNYRTVSSIHDVDDWLADIFILLFYYKQKAYDSIHVTNGETIINYKMTKWLVIAQTR